MKNKAKNKDILEHPTTGLLPLPENPGRRADISHSTVFGALGAEQLPTEDFIVAVPLKIKNQIDLDFCAGFASSEVTEDQEGIEMDPLFQFAAIKKQQGEYKSWGADLRSAGMALVNFGSLPQSIAPYEIGQRTRDFLANWANYPADLWDKAKPYKKQTMFFVDGPHDLFDNIRMTLWQNRLERRSVLLGVVWRKSWTHAPGGVIPEWTQLSDAQDIAGGHCIKGLGQRGFKKIKVPAAGWETINGQLYLIIQNSWGTSLGDGGLYYFPRSVVNKEFGPFGQITFKDMDPEDAHYINDNGIKPEDNWVVQLLRVFASVLLDVFKKFLTATGLA